MKKKYTIFLSFLTFFHIGIYCDLHAQTYSRNFSDVLIPTIPIDDATKVDGLDPFSKIETVNYEDGIGRPVQSVCKNYSPGTRDMVGFNIYDEFGRQPVGYLPFSLADNNGDYIDDIIEKQLYFYTHELKIAQTKYPYAKTVYDESPLNRVKEQGFPGQLWQPGTGGHTMKYEYVFNQTGEVFKWDINEITGEASTSSTYEANTLFINVVKDQNWDGTKGALTKEYHDKTGKLILKSSKLNENESLLTYYVYDEFNNLRIIITPQAVKVMEELSLWNTGDLQEKLVYFFVYDNKQRLIEQKIPGSEPIFMIYDKNNRVVLRQTGTLRSQHKWEFVKYDVHSRTVMNGIYYDATHLSRESMQAWIDSYVDNTTTFYDEVFTGINPNNEHGYSNQAFPPLNQYSEILNVFYYDDYAFDINNDYQYDDYDCEWDEEPFYRTSGKLTCSKTVILNTSPAQWLFTVYYYDKKGRLIRKISDNHLNGRDYIDFKYLFSGLIERMNLYHSTDIEEQQVEEVFKWGFSYDHAGRLLMIKNTINDGPTVTLVQNKYNELGQLVEKNIHSTDDLHFLQSVDYKYHVWGLLKNINLSNLLNDNTAIDLGTALSPTEIVYGFKPDTITLSILEFDEDLKRSPYINLNFADRKKLQVCEDGDTSHNRLLPVNEEALFSLNKEQIDSASYDRLRKLDSLEFTFTYGNITFSSDASQSEITDSLTNLTKSQFSGYGITDSLVIEEISKYIAEFIKERIGIIYFNEDHDDLFGEDILYNEGFDALQGEKQYNGNIAGIRWQAEYFEGEKGYSFHYDNLNRYLSSHYGEKVNGQWNQNIANYEEFGIDYDYNGNIRHMKRRGVIDRINNNPVYGMIDDLTYTYSGNQLKSVNDNVSGNPSPGNDFKDNGSVTSDEYDYNVDGSLIQDDNKGITNIAYNYLNLPYEITFTEIKR